MKKQIFIYAFIFTMYLFHFSFSSPVFADIQQLFEDVPEDVRQLFDDNKELLLRQDVRTVLPDALRIFGQEEIQKNLNPDIIEIILNGPRFLLGVDPNFTSQFVALLSIDDDLRALFRNEQFYDVLKNSNKLDKLVELIEGTPIPTDLEIISGGNQIGDPKPTTLAIVSGNGQWGEPGKPLAKPFVVEVLDQFGNPFVDDVSVTFIVPDGADGDGEFSPTIFDNSGQARTTFTLGAEPGVYYQVEAKASVEGFPSLTQTFIAAATSGQSEIAPEKVTISEIMFVSNIPNKRKLPQWIELNNSSNTDAVDLEGWTLEIHGIVGLPKFDKPSLTKLPLDVNHTGGGTLETTITIIDQSQHQYTQFIFPKRSIKPQETLLIASEPPGSIESSLGQGQVYVLDIRSEFLVLSKLLHEQAFYLKLSNKTGELVDEVGNFNILTNSLDWSLPKSVTEDTPSRRASMIRRHDDGAPRTGTTKDAWISAIKTKLADHSDVYPYYGDPSDIGAPGFKSGGALPVQLSSFRAEGTDAGVAITWSTESELDNAGFTIRRSKTQNGVFRSIHARLILGAGTTSEKNDYTFMDTNAEPGVIYYYQIEDISFGGVRRTLATTRSRRDFSAKDKFTTTWGSLKR